MNRELNLYIEKRYLRWLDYSLYHCTQAGIANEAVDILNEVIVDILEKEEVLIIKLYNAKKDGYRELDYFVLRILKLNIYSPTSPYQSRYNKFKYSELDLARLNITDDLDEEIDKPAQILDQWNKIRDTIEKINLSEKAKYIFHFKFFQGKPFSEWTGPESKKELYETYNKVVEVIKEKINKKSLI